MLRPRDSDEHPGCWDGRLHVGLWEYVSKSDVVSSDNGELVSIQILIILIKTVA